MNSLIFTCEHGGNLVPARYRRLFDGATEVLASHRGYDPGAAALARELARTFAAPLHIAIVTRLLVDLNRSLRQRSLFSEFTRSLAPAERARILARHYTPHVHGIRAAVRTAAARGRVLHIAVHSFTPVLDGAVRNADIGLLYAPGRRLEAALAARLHHAIARIEPDLRVRRNYPYRGGEFGLTEWLRRQFPASSYVGFEIECNQGLLQAPATWRATRRAIAAALREAIGNETPAGAVRR